MRGSACPIFIHYEMRWNAGRQTITPDNIHTIRENKYIHINYAIRIFKCVNLFVVYIN